MVACGFSMGGDISIVPAGIDHRVGRVPAIGSTPDWTRSGLRAQVAGRHRSGDWPGRQALLLEQATPGTSAAALVPGDDVAATAAIIGVTRRLHHPPASHCPFRIWRPRARPLPITFARVAAPMCYPGRWVQLAAGLFGELCASSPGKVVLHGDLHHDNVLQATREPWLAIDPDGVVGDPGYERVPCSTTPGRNAARPSCSHWCQPGSSNSPPN